MFTSSVRQNQFNWKTGPVFVTKSLIESPIEKIRLKRVIDLLIRHHYLSQEHFSMSTALNLQCFPYTKLLYSHIEEI